MIYVEITREYIRHATHEAIGGLDIKNTCQQFLGLHLKILWKFHMSWGRYVTLRRSEVMRSHEKLVAVRCSDLKLDHFTLVQVVQPEYIETH